MILVVYSLYREIEGGIFSMFGFLIGMFNESLFESLESSSGEIKHSGCSQEYKECDNSACGSSTNTDSCTNRANKCDGSSNAPNRCNT